MSTSIASAAADCETRGFTATADDGETPMTDALLFVLVVGVVAVALAVDVAAVVGWIKAIVARRREG